MSDRFKFRCWDKQRGVYEDAPKLLNQKGELISYHVWNDLSNFYDIEQCTGLKDKNGKLIYENDIVEIKVWDDIEEDMVETKGKVYWSREDAAFLICVSYDAEYSLNSHETFYGQEIEVIGNIHENADLLEN